MTGEGTLIGGRYRLGTEIGSGAMGVVWQASDERLHRTVALKQLLLPAGLSVKDAAAARARIMREGRIAARLQHPGTISIYDVIEHDTQPWLVMEYLPSRSLAAWLAEHGPLRPEDAALMGTAVATALAAAHVAGVVHRDVKPGNILLGEDGSVKITDFGISRANGDVTVTATGMLAGTPGYLAPEMARGEPPAPSSDVFSLGSTLYAAVEGRAPFAGSDNQLAILHAVAAGEFEPPRRAGRMTALLMRLMRADPVQRPTMAQAAHALAEIAEGRTVPATALVPEIPPDAARQPENPQDPAAHTAGPGDTTTPATPAPGVLPGVPAANGTAPGPPARNGTAPDDITDAAYRSFSAPTAPQVDRIRTRHLGPGTPQGTPLHPAQDTGPDLGPNTGPGTGPGTGPNAGLDTVRGTQPTRRTGVPHDPRPPGRAPSGPDRGHWEPGRRQEPARHDGADQYPLRRPSARSVALAVLAVVVAAAIGIGVASLLMSISGDSAAAAPTSTTAPHVPG